MVDQRFYMSVHLMTELAFRGCREGVLSTSEELAKGIRTNGTVVRRLVAKLVSAGLLKAYKGKKGGVELARCPEEITLEEIYLATSEEPLLKAPKRAAKKQCPISCSMGAMMGEVFEGVERQSREYLRGITLAKFAGKIEV